LSLNCKEVRILEAGLRIAASLFDLLVSVSNKYGL